MNLIGWARGAFMATALVFAGALANAKEPPRLRVPAPGKVIIVFHTRVAAARAIPEGQLVFRRYDRATGRLGGKMDSFAVGRWIGLVSNKSMRNWRGWALEIDPGSYVLVAVTNPNLAKREGPSLARTWAFDLAPGTVTGISDFTLQWTKLQKGWGLEVVPEFDEARARAFAATKTQPGVTFVTAPVRPVELSQDVDKNWSVRDAQ
jgi:hypothetical protein